MPSDVKAVQEVKQKEKILEMRVAGKSVEEISKALIVSESQIRVTLNESWREAAANVQRYADLLVAFDIQRLETLVDKLMIKALEELDYQAIDRVAKLIKLKYTMVTKNTEKPVNVNVSGNLTHTHEQVFTANSDEYTLAIQALSQNPNLLSNHPNFHQIQAKLSAFAINKGTPEMDDIIEAEIEE